MKIVHVISGLGVGGAERMLKRLVEPQSDTLNHVVLSLTDLGPIGRELRHMGVTVEALGCRRALELPLLVPRLVGRISEHRPDVVQTWMYHSDLVGGLAARAAGVPAIVWGVRTADVRSGNARATYWVQRVCAILSRRLPSRIVYVANAARRAHEAAGYAPTKGIVIPNGYASVEPNIDAREIRARLGIDADAVVIGSVGRFNEAKDHRTFTEAAALVAASDARAVFLMVGRGINAHNAKLNGWIAATGHADRFRLVEEVDDVGPYLGAMDLFCLHSMSEAFPNVVAEAMSGGLPCVVTNVGDAGELVGDTGWVVPAANPARLADALRTQIAAGSAARAEAGARARRRIEQHFSVDNVRRQYRSLYASLIGVELPDTRGEVDEHRQKS